MTKIKNFRILLRPREVARLLKSRERLQITPALEESIEHAIGDSRRLLQPAAVYTTLTRAVAEKAASWPLADPAVAVSLAAATLGPALEQELASVSARQDALQIALLRAVREEALQQAVQFIFRLIQDQAREEECELSAPQGVTEDLLLSAVGPLLGIQRIGIELEKDTRQLPPYARLVWAAWTPVVRVKGSSKSSAIPSVAAATEGRGSHEGSRAQRPITLTPTLSPQGRGK